jgi:hypothetical protein
MPIVKTFSNAIKNGIKKKLTFTEAEFNLNPDGVASALSPYLVYFVERDNARHTITYYVYSKNGNSVEDGETPPEINVR